jgi:hypothetical protein
MKRANTVGVIASRLRKPVHCVTYVIESRGIEPIAVAGNSRVFDEAAVQRIDSELKRIESDRNGGCE